MAMWFESGTLPNGDKADMFVMERGVSDKAVFPADALTPDGQTTYREKYGSLYDTYKNGDSGQKDLDPAAHPANPDLSNHAGAFPGQPAGAPPAKTDVSQQQAARSQAGVAPSQPIRSEPETVRPPASNTNVGADKAATDKATASKT